jgi:hypothetical protein
MAPVGRFLCKMATRPKNANGGNVPCVEMQIGGPEVSQSGPFPRLVCESRVYPMVENATERASTGVVSKFY